MKINLFIFVVFSLIISSCATPTPLVTSPVQNDLPTQETAPTAFHEPVNIQFWEWYGGAWADFLEEEVVLFHDEYPWINVTISHHTDQNAYREALALAFESDSAPDTFTRRHTFQQVFENKWALPIDQWITSEWRAKFPSGSFIETKNVWEGKVYSFPYYANKFDRVLYINEDMFRDAGLVDASGEITTPKTWSELRSMAKRITETGNGKYYGVGIGIKDPRHMSWWFDLANLAGSAGTYEIDYRDARYHFGADPAFKDIIDLLLGMKNDGSVYPNESALDDSNLYSFFGQQKYAIFLSGTWSANNIKKDFPDFKNFRVIPLPYPDSGRRGGLPYAPGSGVFYISAQTKHPEESWLWLDWLSTREHHIRMVSKGLDFSIYQDLNSSKYITDQSKLQAYKAVTENLVLVPFPPARNPMTASVRPKAVVPDIGDILVGIYTGQITDWDRALKDLDIAKYAAFEEALTQAKNEGAQVTIDDFIFADWDPMKDYVTEPAK